MYNDNGKGDKRYEEWFAKCLNSLSPSHNPYNCHLVCHSRALYVVKCLARVIVLSQCVSVCMLPRPVADTNRFRATLA